MKSDDISNHAESLIYSIDLIIKLNTKVSALKEVARAAENFLLNDLWQPHFYSDLERAIANWKELSDKLDKQELKNDGEV